METQEILAVPALLCGGETPGKQHALCWNEMLMKHWTNISKWTGWRMVY